MKTDRFSFIIRLLAVILSIAIALPLMGCSHNQSGGGKIKILCTLFPQYDWVKSIVGNSQTVEVSLLVANGADPHSYQPTAADILAISSCDMIVFTGGDSDTWVKDAIERTENPKIKQIKLMELDGVTLHSISAVSDDHDHGHDHAEHNHGVFDEHIWLSIKNAAAITAALADSICELDSENSLLYRQNANDYISRLNALDKDFTSFASSVPEEKRFLIFADRFPFVYLLSDYGIGYRAAFEGCTTDVDADFDTVLGLIHEAELHGVSCIAVTESSDKALARTVASSVKQGELEVLTFNSMQSVNLKQAENGTSYISITESNLNVLKSALSQ